MVATPPRRPYAARLPAGERREQLLDAALAIALAEGFHAVTVDGVARAAGVTRPVVYGQFEDRGALLHALVERGEQRAVTQLEHVLPRLPASDADPDSLLVDGLAAFLRAVADDPATWRVVLVPPEGAPGELRERVAAVRRRVRHALRELVEWGLLQRGGPHDLDTELFARSVQALSEGAAALLLADPEQWPVERFTSFARTLLAALDGRADAAPRVAR